MLTVDWSDYALFESHAACEWAEISYVDFGLFE